MTFKIYNHNYNIPELLRRLGYKPRGTTPQGETEAVHPLGADYPRFHIYLKEEKASARAVLVFNIHLDQKKPVYEGVTAHSGDYESDIVKDEVQRIKDIIFQ